MKHSITEFINTLLLQKNDIIAIDGPCGGGKSTLADLISKKYDVDTIHLDDFFLPIELRTTERLGEIGGNVHYERFFSEVIMGIHSQNPFTYQRFSCAIMDYSDTITIQNNKPIIIEGSYSLRPDFQSIYTKKIYLSVDSTTQKQRLISRVGEEKFQDFQTLWIPKELTYFQHYHIKDVADIAL